MTESRSNGVDAHTGLGLLRVMKTIRRFDEVAAEQNLTGNIRGAVHPYIGQEAIATGICSVLQRYDYISSYHRGHGHTIAKGADPVAMMAELFGRSTGLCHGKAGSLHVADISIGMLGANGIVGDGVTMAVGAAQAARLLKSPAIAVAFFGDGAINRGPVLEAMNWAEAFGLKVLFVCEDNLYSYTVRTASVTGGAGITARATGFGIPACVVDGNDVIAVRQTAAEMLAVMQRSGGPALMHALTYRERGHIARDQGAYRPVGEAARYKALDPIVRCTDWLQAIGVTRAQIDTVTLEVDELIARALREAQAAPFPDTSELFSDAQDLGAPSWEV